MRAERVGGGVGDSSGCSGFGVLLRGLCLSPGFDEGSADDAGADEGDLGYYSVGLEGGFSVSKLGVLEASGGEEGLYHVCGVVGAL